MDLSREEWDEARRAKRRLKECLFWDDRTHWIPLALSYSILILDGILYVRDRLHGAPTHPFFPLLWLVWLLNPVVLYFKLRYLKRRRPGDVQLLETLLKKAGGELPRAGEIAYDASLLERWDRRFVKRQAILWRLDRFLSRQPISD